MLAGFLTIASLHILAVMSPGPDFAMIIKNSLMYSRRTAIVTAAGIALGIWVHVLYCVLGLAVVIARSAILFNIVKYIGAFYLVYVGIGALRAKRGDDGVGEIAGTGGETPPLQIRALNNMTALKQGFLCNVLNPKATLFFLSLYTLVVSPQTPIWLQFAYGTEMFLATFLWFAFLGTMITHPKFKEKIERVQGLLTKITGGVFILFGVKLALTTRTLP